MPLCPTRAFFKYCEIFAKFQISSSFPIGISLAAQQATHAFSPPPPSPAVEGVAEVEHEGFVQLIVGYRRPFAHQFGDI